MCVWSRIQNVQTHKINANYQYVVFIFVHKYI